MALALALSSLNSASSSIAVALAAPYAYNFWFVTLPLPPLVWLELAVVELPAVFDVEGVVVLGVAEAPSVDDDVVVLSVDSVDATG